MMFNCNCGKCLGAFEDGTGHISTRLVRFVDGRFHVKCPKCRAMRPLPLRAISTGPRGRPVVVDPLTRAVPAG